MAEEIRVTANSPSQPVDPRVVDIFRSVTRDPDLDVRWEMHRRDVPGWTSMAHIQLILAVESQFGIKFRPSEIAKFATVGQLCTLITAKTR